MTKLFEKGEFRDVMLDLETLGRKPGCVILSIGAVEFGPQGLGREFYTVLNVQNSLEHGLHTDRETIEWWGKQGDEASAVLMQANDPLQSAPLGLALGEFTAWLPATPMRRRIWGNGSTFDNAILRAAYDAVGREYPTAFWNDMCFRTLKTLLPPKYRTKPTIAHHALADAKAQATDAVDMFRRLQQAALVDEAGAVR